MPAFLTRGKLIVLVFAGYGAFLAFNFLRAYQGVDSDVQTIRTIVASEELILKLTPKLKELSRSVLNLKLPDWESEALFDDELELVDLRSRAEPSSGSGVAGEAPDDLVSNHRWPIEAGSQKRPADQLRMWRALFEEVAYFEHAKFYVIRGDFNGDGYDEFTSEIGFKGLARARSGHWLGVKAKQHVLWRRTTSGSPSDISSWRISDWRTQSLETTRGDRTLFAEVLDHALPLAGDLDRARNSEHHRQVIKFYEQRGAWMPWAYFTPISANLKPGLAVVDVDRDGWDDLYVMVRAGRNQLLHNRGDGTFEEMAGELNLDVNRDTTCAIFADFDNDGDSDAMLGRTLQRSMYLENIDGRFVERPNVLGSESLPYLVVSMSAADYNGDGLLDVYLCRYRPAVFDSVTSHGDSAASDDSQDPSDWLQQFLTEAQAREFRRRFESAARDGDSFKNVLNQIGPPNVLLVNQGGGKFAIAPESSQLDSWRNTLQATWCDFDEDGDPDLYVANDWAPDHLLRNDGSKGFVDITTEAGTSAFGFAMGASWGDYDNDGRMDLYVSNMYSKAGRRITAQIPDLDATYGRSAEGNYLYKSQGDAFELVSGLEPPALTVAEAGWSWGGQFVDFDNDGFQDIYVLSGYFTAPKEFSSELDL